MSAFQISSCLRLILGIVSQPKPSFDGGGGGGAVGGEESLFVGKTAFVANWQTDLLFCLRA